MSEVRFVAVGECMVELFGEEPVALDEAERFRASFGGDAVQAALAAANLGTPSAVATVVGDDPFAVSLLRWLERSGISTEHVARRPGYTGLYLISIGSDGERSFVYYRTGSAGSTLDVGDVDRLPSSGAVLVTGITQAISGSSRRAALEAARRANAAGGRLVFDVNYRPRLWAEDSGAARDAFEEIAPLCRVLRLSAPEETELVAGESDPVTAAMALARRIPVVVVGCGARGAVVAADREVERVPAPPVACLDTTGAGDALTGGVVHGLLAGMSAVEATRIGVAAGSLAVTRRGGGSSMPPGDEVMAMVERMTAGVSRYQG